MQGPPGPTALGSSMHGPPTSSAPPPPPLPLPCASGGPPIQPDRLPAPLPAERRHEAFWVGSSPSSSLLPPALRPSACVGWGDADTNGGPLAQRPRLRAGLLLRVSMGSPLLPLPPLLLPSGPGSAKMSICVCAPQAGPHMLTVLVSGHSTKRAPGSPAGGLLLGAVERLGMRPQAQDGMGSRERPSKARLPVPKAGAQASTGNLASPAGKPHRWACARPVPWLVCGWPVRFCFACLPCGVGHEGGRQTGANPVHALHQGIVCQALVSMHPNKATALKGVIYTVVCVA